jgi:uncharacterized membrane protein YhdT
MISRCLSCLNIFFPRKETLHAPNDLLGKKNRREHFFALVFLVTFHLNGFLGNGIKYFCVRGSNNSVNGKYLWRLSVFVRFFNYQESMKMMGLPNWLHWTAWFVKSLVFILITIMLITFMLKVKVTLKSHLIDFLKKMLFTGLS